MVSWRRRPWQGPPCNNLRHRREVLGTQSVPEGGENASNADIVKMFYAYVKNGLSVLLKGLGKRSPLGILGSELLGPVESDVEVGSPVVNLLDLAAGGPVVVQPLADGIHECLAEQLGLGVVGPVSELGEPDGGGEVLSQGVPPQVTLLQELLNVLGGGATGTSLQENSSSEKRDNGQHLGGGAELKDGEEVGEVVPEHVSSDGDGVLAGPGPLARNLGLKQEFITLGNSLIVFKRTRYLSDLLSFLG